MKQIIKREIEDSRVDVPGSKSLSHRLVIMASLAKGKSTIQNILKSDDIGYTVTGLKKMGALISEKTDNALDVYGFGGKPSGTSQEIFLGNSGTSLRLLAGVAALGRCDYTLTGDERMCQRPMGDLTQALRMAGIKAYSKNKTGTPPVVINGKNSSGGKVEIDCSNSSQYLSSLLITGPLLKKGLDITVKGKRVSSPYIELTIETMKNFGVAVEKKSGVQYWVAGNQNYLPGVYTVEPDFSNAGYFWAAGAVTGKMVTVLNADFDSLQGDIRLVHILKEMGCCIQADDVGIGVRGNGSLKSVDVDMADIPDAVPALAVVAAFASGRTVIKNVAHLRQKECDRIDAVSSQLNKMGITVETGEDWLAVQGGTPRGAVIETFNDHRIAMAFSVSGLVTDGVVIENEGCVAKSFPNYWEKFDAL